MPDEGSRTTARKTIVLPSGDTIKVPVITKIAFIDPYERYQESEHTIDCTVDSDRVVHIDKVHPVFPVDRNGKPTEETPNQDDSQDLFVERIDTWHALDPYERYQETHLTLDNATGNDLLPPSFTNHEKTHIYRYYQDPTDPDDDGVWVDAELIDEFSVIDPYERYQEKHYTLNNPTNEEFDGGDLSGQANIDDPDITIAVGEGEGTEDNPVRLDPFQNIVNYSGDIWIGIGFQITTDHDIPLCPVGSVIIDGIHWTSLSYLGSVTCGLTYDGTSAAVLRTNGDTEDAVGATWSYSGGATSVIAGPFAPNVFFPDSPVVCEDAPTNNYYQEFKSHQFTGEEPHPIYYNTLSVVVNAWALAGDGILYRDDPPGPNPTPVGFMQSATYTSAPPSDVISIGEINGSRTFNFSGITVTYKGASFVSVAVRFQTHGQVISVLCKRQTTTA